MTRRKTRGEEVVKKECVLTMAEAEEEMRCYRKVFNVVRILHKDEIGGIYVRGKIRKNSTARAILSGARSVRAITAFRPARIRAKKTR